ncbi:DUF3108 domain-containing protein [Pelomicrobium methylotrophicum]|uniref:DUF3108 domain-containing protein n=1 Tax=Pelomicrobium methylotrophicum TaxID=2602750 RepID=A0A5C7EQK5_9PROT|nr:DUF3108 domain-containing protein [Pelomicrobium methylotrophicum]TXF13780.1 DUF3108 domain-containing protein [Pelomicrobium methylotrophicum]
MVLLSLRTATALSALGLLGACATLAPVGTPVPAPHARAGDTWTYAVYDGYRGTPKGTERYVVRRVTPHAIVVSVETGAGALTRTFSLEWNPSAGELPEQRLADFTPPLPAFAFPLEDGKRWKGTVTAVEAKTGRRYSVHVSARVAGRETIETPAGSFDTVRVDRAIYLDNDEWWRSGTRWYQSEWYAPAVGRSVRYQDYSEYTDYTKSNDEFLIRSQIIPGDKTVLELTAPTSLK